MTPTPPKTSLAKAPLAIYLAVGGLVVMVAALGIGTLTGHFDHAVAVRYFGILMGLLMLASGNALPKLIMPWAAGARAARMAGWLLVLGGLGVVALWVFTPTADRILIASATGLAVFALVLVVALIMTAGNRSDSAVSPEMRRAAIHRSLLFHILHGVMWSFAFFLAATLGYGKAVPWLVAAFTVSMSILDLCMGRRPRKKNVEL